MAVNKNAKNLTSLSLAALKAAGHEMRAWFAVQVGKDFLFYIDKKITQPRKFKEPLALQKVLTALKVREAKDINAKSLVIAGTIQSAGEAYEMTVGIKSNGGGKSTLKTLLLDATFKRIVGNVEIVKQHGGNLDLDDVEMDASIKTEMKEEGIAGVKVVIDEENNETIEVPENLRKALKVFKWWDAEGRATLEGFSGGASVDDEDTLQTINRRLKKFAKEKMYKLFADGIIWDGPLKKLRPKHYDLTKDVLRDVIKQTEDLLDNLQDSKGETDFDDLASEIVTAIEDDAEELGELEMIGKRLKLNDSQFLQFMDAGRGHLVRIKDLVSKYSNEEVKALLKYMGGGNWDRFIFQLEVLSNWSDLAEAVQMATSVKNLCKYFDRYQSFEPFEIVQIAKSVRFDKPAFKEKMGERQAVVDAQMKRDSYEMVLFSHPDIGASYLADVDDRIIVGPGWTFQVDITLKANTPKELNYGLNNPRILQKIKDAGDFSGMMSAMQGEYRRLVDKYFDETQESLDVIERKLLKFIERQKEGAIENAMTCAKAEFGKKANIAYEQRSRALTCTFNAVTLGFGVMATAAGFATTLAAGLVGLHGTLKALDSTVRAFRSSYQGFERNMRDAEGSYKTAGTVVDTMRADAGQIGARILQTAFGELSNSFAKGKQYLDMAEGDLEKIDDRTNDIVVGLEKYIIESDEVTKTMENFEQELNVLKSVSTVPAEKVSKMERELAQLKDTVTNIRLGIHNIMENCAQQSNYVDNCKDRINKVKGVAKEC